MARVNTCRSRYQFWDSNASVSNIVQNAENFPTSASIVCECAVLVFGSAVELSHVTSHQELRWKKRIRFLLFQTLTRLNFIFHWSHHQNYSLLFRSHFSCVEFDASSMLAMCDVTWWKESNQTNAKLISAFTPQWTRLSHQNYNESKIKCGT